MAAAAYPTPKLRLPVDGLTRLHTLVLRHADLQLETQPATTSGDNFTAVLPALRSMSLVGCHAPRATLALLRRLPAALTSLAVEKLSEATEEGAPPQPGTSAERVATAVRSAAARLTQLRTLRLVGVDVDAAVLPVLRGLGQLRALCIAGRSHNALVAPASFSVAGVLRACSPHVTSLTLHARMFAVAGDAPDGAAPDGAAPVPWPPELCELQLEGTRLHPDVLAAPSLTSLTRLVLDACLPVAAVVPLDLVRARRARAPARARLACCVRPAASVPRPRPPRRKTPGMRRTSRA